MFAEERQREILERLKQSGTTSVDELASELGVSAPTIRTDLTHLEAKRLLRRTHGGAIAIETTLWEPPYAERERANQAEKTRIAAVAAEVVRDNETVLIDAGTTNYEIARRLKDRSGLTVVTNSLEAAWSLMDAPAGKIQVVLMGGNLQRERRALLGPLAAEFLNRLYFDHAFIGVNGVHPDAGYTVVDFDAANLKRAMISHAREVLVVADRSKLGKSTFASIGPLSIAHVLITDSAVDEPLATALALASVETIVAP
jgi:DeoR family fructose operon transcriptional repressor